MKTVQVRNVELGCGIAKVCVPIVARTRPELVKCLKEVAQTACDLVEFRADYYTEEETDALQAVRSAVGERPVLYTLRTLEEGGSAQVDQAEYEARTLRAASFCDLADVQLGRLADGSLLEKLHREQIPVIGSFHDFDKTPDAGELVQTLLNMQKAGFDITKLAVMPHSREDVLEVLKASVQMAREADRPYITLSMGDLGTVTRTACAFTGSCLTFGAVTAASAPGQPEAGALLRILELFAGEKRHSS